MPAIFHPPLALIASATDRELAKYIQFLKEENKIFRARILDQVHTRPLERERLMKFGKTLGLVVAELGTIVSQVKLYCNVSRQMKSDSLACRSSSESQWFSFGDLWVVQNTVLAVVKFRFDGPRRNRLEPDSSGVPRDCYLLWKILRELVFVRLPVRQIGDSTSIEPRRGLRSNLVGRASNLGQL